MAASTVLTAAALALTQGSCMLIGYDGVARGRPGADAAMGDPTAFDATTGSGRGVTTDAETERDGSERDAAYDASAVRRDAGRELDAGSQAGGPEDASMVDANSPASPDDASTPADAGALSHDAGVPADAGQSSCAVSFYGACWYLGALGASCTQVCAAHGGASPAAVSAIGTGTQGGSADKCHQVMTALGSSAGPVQSYRVDGLGLGCHRWSTGIVYWLASPAYNADSSSASAQRACGCVD